MAEPKRAETYRIANNGAEIIRAETNRFEINRGKKWDETNRLKSIMLKP